LTANATDGTLWATKQEKEKAMPTPRKYCQQCGERRITIETPFGRWWCRPCFSEEFFVCKVCKNTEDARDKKQGMCLDCATEAGIYDPLTDVL
jgi:hypothetical protein